MVEESDNWWQERTKRLIIILFLAAFLSLGANSGSVRADAVLFSDGFESYAAGVSPPNVRVGSMGWYHGDDGTNLGDGSGADIDQPGAGPTASGYHRVYDNIPTHSGSKAVKFLSDRKAGCKVSMMVRNLALQTGDYQVTDLWLNVPSNWLIGSTSRSPVIKLTIASSVNAIRDTVGSNVWRWTITDLGDLGTYAITEDVWHHIQIVYNQATWQFVDIVIDDTHPFAAALPSLPEARGGVWTSGVWWENRRMVPPFGDEHECVEDTGFQAQIYVDDFQVLQLESWQGQTGTYTTTSAITTTSQGGSTTIQTTTSSSQFSTSMITSTSTSGYTTYTYPYTYTSTHTDTSSVTSTIISTVTSNYTSLTTVISNSSSSSSTFTANSNSTGAMMPFEVVTLISTFVTQSVVVETAVGTSTDTQLVSSSSTVMALPPIPGFPTESVLAGLILGLAVLAIIRRHRESREH